ncbi:Coiled-coil domain-containing protein 96 [Phytophthora cinnamomi]|uniref:Coiled-coil domain-containing protein 96 n=1 Tax=Phytophthora cinnamomi TaxID=4785 RepID=UPI0035596838|nr:Coiled-coil domain-containing protein 96 [Phytophthora cinnamomi]
MALPGSNQEATPEEEEEEEEMDVAAERRGSQLEPNDEEQEDDDVEELDEEEAARQEARRLRTAIAEATEARDELQQRNTKLQRRIAALLQKNQENSAATSSSGASSAAAGDAANTGPAAAGRREDKASASENAKRYLECLRGVHEAKVQMVTAQSQYDKVALELQARLDEKEAKVTEIQDAFLEFKREVARNAENLRTGKPIAKRVIAQFEATELRKDQEVEKVRLKHINLRTHLKKLEQQLHAKEQLAEGLHLIDFEQLKIENQTLNEKIEERNEELHKLRKKTTSTVQVLTHIKEKLQFVLAESQMLKRDSQELEEALTANRDQLAHKKKDRDAARQLAARLKSKEGFAKSELLIEDFEKRENDLVDLERRRAELIQRHALLTKQAKQTGKLPS